jgi:hypothetical protein
MSVPPCGIPDTALILNGLTMLPVPEPSVIGLGVLGRGTLLLLRRRGCLKLVWKGQSRFPVRLAGAL